ncbi:MAG: SGNH/GDSL hydrolase family protein [Cyclobacteriaceae bacterium]
MDQAKPTWLALGDSYTIGESVDMEARWPHQLTHRLGYADPTYLATTGWTTLDLQQAIEQTTFNPPYDWVSLLIGVNDQYQGLDIANYPREFEQLLDFAISQATTRPQVLVLSIPDYSVTPYAQRHDPEKIAAEIARYNEINQEISLEKGVQYCDITPLSLLAAEDLSLLAEDELHPSGKMYRLWVDKILYEIPFP